MESLAASMLDIEKIRGQFPVLAQEVNGKPLVYFDNAASSQTVKSVTDALVNSTIRIMQTFTVASIR